MMKDLPLGFDFFFKNRGSFFFLNETSSLKRQLIFFPKKMGKS